MIHFVPLELIFLELYIYKLSDCTHNCLTHSEDSVGGVEAVSPGYTQYVWQVKPEVDQSSTRSSQVGFREEGTDEETLHDGSGGERCQEEKHNSWVAVRQDVPTLKRRQTNSRRFNSDYRTQMLQKLYLQHHKKL